MRNLNFSVYFGNLLFMGDPCAAVTFINVIMIITLLPVNLKMKY